VTVAERILRHLQELPEPLQAEVLDFVEYLETRAHEAPREPEDAAWSAFSLSHVMRGLEGEPALYFPNDIKEAFA
jgi:hypothetical protein